MEVLPGKSPQGKVPQSVNLLSVGALDSQPLPFLLQVLTSVPDCPGHMTILDQPLLICGGDAFSHSNFDGCVESALSMLSVLKASLTPGQEHLTH